MTEDDGGAEETAWHEIRRRIAGEAAETPGNLRKFLAPRESEDDEERETDSGEETEEERWQETVAAIDLSLGGERVLVKCVGRSVIVPLIAAIFPRRNDAVTLTQHDFHYWAKKGGKYVLPPFFLVS